MKLTSLRPLRDANLNAPIRGVVEIETARGPRGGRILVYLLSCGHWFWSRAQGGPRIEAHCIECALEDQLRNTGGS